jgi:glutathione S-transferase
VFNLTETSAILKYLAEAIGSAAYPRDAEARAQVNAWMDWFNTGFYRDLGYGLVYPQILPDYSPPTAVRSELLTDAEKRSRRWLDILDQQISGAGGPFVLGHEITLVDYLGSSYATLAELVSFDFSPWPHVCCWLSAMAARPAWPEVNAAFYGWSSALRAQAA